MTDKILEQAVLSALHVDPLTNVGRIAVRERDGVVTLIGEVDTQTQRSAARYKAQRVAGVKDVVDELEVRVAARAEQRAEDVAANVLNALFWDVAVPTDRVSARCEKGWVTLTGEVERPYQKTSAEADCRKIRGVIGVTNEIKVGSNAPCRIDTPSRGEGILLGDRMGAIADDRNSNVSARAPLS